MRNLRIATWNVERLKTLLKVPSINTIVRELAADILVLTETHDCISPGKDYSVCSSLPLAPNHDGNNYRDGERSVSIYSVFPFIEQLPVTNPYTTVCGLAETPWGPLAIYGCIIGILGNRREGFCTDLKHQVNDLAQISRQYPVCYSGDFNVTFCDNYYSNKAGKEFLECSFSRFKMQNLTANIPENVDHIVVSEGFLSESSIQHYCWNEEKKLSDHKGVMIIVNNKKS